MVVIVISVCLLFPQIVTYIYMYSNIHTYELKWARVSKCGPSVHVTATLHLFPII